MLSLLIRAVNRCRPRDGWALLLLSLTALLCPAGALIATSRDLESGGTVLLSVLAVLSGLRFSRTRLSAWAATAWASVLGVVLAVTVVGRLLPPLSLLWAEVEISGQWLGPRPAGAITAPRPL